MLTKNVLGVRRDQRRRQKRQQAQVEQELRRRTRLVFEGLKKSADGLWGVAEFAQSGGIWLNTPKYQSN